VPGLKLVVPSGPRNARALLVSAIRDPDPVIFFEASALYHGNKEEGPAETEALPIGQARVAQEGRDLTLSVYGAMVRVALEAAEVLRAEDGAEAEVIDLLTLSPLDRETLVGSVAKTGRAVVVHEAPRSFGPGAEIAASLMEGAFLALEAPIRRVAAVDVPWVGVAPAAAGGARPGAAAPGAPARPAGGGPVPAAPATRRLARELGVDLRAVEGTGPGGGVTDADVRGAGRAARPEAPGPPEAPGRPAGPRPLAPVGLEPPALPRFEQWGPIERLPLSHLRRTIAERMALSAA